MVIIRRYTRNVLWNRTRCINWIRRQKKIGNLKRTVVISQLVKIIIIIRIKPKRLAFAAWSFLQSKYWHTSPLPVAYIIIFICKHNSMNCHCTASERERVIRQFVIVKNKLKSVCNASVLLLTMNFVITLSK